MNNINYLIFNSYLQAFADAHYQVMRYGSDFVDQLQNFGSKGTTYPLLYCAPANYNFRPNKFTGSRLNELTVNIYCIDLLLDDRSNVNPILNTTSCILNDLFKWLTEAQLPGVDLLSVSPLRPLNNYTMESCAGWVMTATVQLESYGLCDIPFEFPPVLPNTGEIVPTPPSPPIPSPPPPPPQLWRLNYSIFSGIYTPNIGGPPLDCNLVPLNGVAQNNSQFQIGSWNTVIPFQLENEIQYMGNTPRTFNIAASISCSTPNPGVIEYSYRKTEGSPFSQGVFVLPPGATGTVVTGGVAHAPVSLYGTWTPSVPGDKFGLALRYCGSPSQVVTVASANVTITQQITSP